MIRTKMKINRVSYISLLIFLTFSFSLLGPIVHEPVKAQAGSANELIDAVNQLRAEYGLPAYQIDGNLMAVAQSHSDYQASVNTITHQRADGTYPGDLGFTENIAGGMGLSVQQAIYSIWTDLAHMNTMVGISSGYVGAGVSVGDNGVVYYTLDVKRDAGGTLITVPTLPSSSSGTQTAGGTPAATQEVVITVRTNTPAPDGSIYHEAQNGQTLWEIAIAYGKTVADLITLNFLSPSNPVIYQGQKIVVQASYTPTITPTITLTPLPPTRTPRPTYTPRPTMAAKEAVQTSTPTAKPFLPKLNALSASQKRSLAVGLLVISGTGIILTLYAGMRKKE